MNLVKIENCAATVKPQQVDKSDLVIKYFSSKKKNVSIPLPLFLEHEKEGIFLSALIEVQFEQYPSFLDAVHFTAVDDLTDFLPENEIYGRSLSTLRRLGQCMIGGTYIDAITSPEAEQAKVEFFTSVEEGFGTDLEFGSRLEVRDFDSRPVVDGRVVAKDLKTPISFMTQSGLDCAHETLNSDERFLPQFIRSGWDHDNALKVDKMVRGETSYNTRIVISPFPEEAAVVSGDKYWRDIGYVPHLRRGFVQLYHAAKDGQLVTGSLSFDGSSKQKLRNVQNKYGVEIPEDESTDNWLMYAIEVNMTEDEAKKLALEIADRADNLERTKTINTVDVTHYYKPIMERVFNESYVHVCESLRRGYQTSETRELVQQLFSNAHNFNNRYFSALSRMRVSDNFTDDDSIVLHELLVYSTIEMMRSLHLKKSVTHVHYVHTDGLNPDYITEQLQKADTATFQNMLGNFGADGAKNNRTYSACGLSISAGDENGGGPQDTFGGTDKEKSGYKWMNCPHCKALVYDDPCARILKCSDCKASVIYGNINKGNGGRKAREAKRREEKKKQKEMTLARMSAEALKATNEQFARA